MLVGASRTRGRCKTSHWGKDRVNAKWAHGFCRVGQGLLWDRWANNLVGKGQRTEGTRDWVEQRWSDGAAEMSQGAGCKQRGCQCRERKLRQLKSLVCFLKPAHHKVDQDPEQRQEVCWHASQRGFQVKRGFPRSSPGQEGRYLFRKTCPSLLPPHQLSQCCLSSLTDSTHDASLFTEQAGRFGAEKFSLGFSETVKEFWVFSSQQN